MKSLKAETGLQSICSSRLTLHPYPPCSMPQEAKLYELHQWTLPVWLPLRFGQREAHEKDYCKEKKVEIVMYSFKSPNS